MMLSPSVTAKPPDKKLQGALKSVVKAFGDLLFTWRDLHSSLNNQLSLISNLLHTEHSIHSTLNVRSKYYHSMTSSNFHDLRDRLRIILLKEMERTLTTVRDSMYVCLMSVLLFYSKKVLLLYTKPRFRLSWYRDEVESR